MISLPAGFDAAQLFSDYAMISVPFVGMAFMLVAATVLKRVINCYE